MNQDRADRMRQKLEKATDRNLQAKLHSEQLHKLSSLEGSMLAANRQLINYLEGKVTKTEVINQLKSVGTPDALKVVTAVNELHQTLKNKKTDLSEVTKLLKALVDKKQPEIKIPEQLDTVKVSNLIDNSKEIQAVEKAIKGLKLEAPKVVVAAPNVNVVAPKVDLRPLETPLLQILKAIKDTTYPEVPKTDLSAVEKKLDESNKHLEDHSKKLQKIIEKPMGGGGGGGGSSFKNAAGNLVYVELTADGKVPVDSGAASSGLTDAQLRATPVPVSGTVTATPTGTQNVDVTANTIGLATSAKQDLLLTELQLKADLTETQPVSLAAVPSHAVTNAGTFAVQNTAATPAGNNNIGDVDVATLPVAFNTGTRSATTQRVTIATDDSVPVTGTFWQATQPVSAASLPLPTGAATAANQLPNNHNVVVTSAPTTAVTGPLTDTQLRATAVPVSGTVTATPTGTQDVQGNVAHDAADSGNPVKIGGKVSTSTPTPLTNGKRIDASFDEYGRQVVTDRDPETGYSQGTTSLRDRLVVQRYTVLSDSVADGLNGIWTLSTTGTGVTPTVVAGSGEGTLQTSAAINSSSQMVSTVLRYHPGQESWFNSAFRFAAATTGNTQRIGACTVSGTTPQDGFYFERNGTTFDAVVVKAGVEFSRTASTSWTRFTQAPFTVDTSYHSYELRFTANGVSFYADNILRHRVTGGSTTLTSTLDFPMFIQNLNTTNATNITVGIRNIGMGRFGTPPTEYTSGSILADQTGAGSVRTFTFTTPVDFVWVTDIGATTTNVSRVDPFGGTPAATTGIPVLNGAPTPINVVPASSTIRVYVPVGSTITMHGFRYV